MNTTNRDVELECEDFLNRFFDSNRDDALRKRSLKALRFLVADDEPLSGRPGGWAAGIVYALPNRYRLPCGVPGLLNKDLEEFFGVTIAYSGAKRAWTMGTIRNLAGKSSE